MEMGKIPLAQNCQLIRNALIGYDFLMPSPPNNNIFLIATLSILVFFLSPPTKTAKASSPTAPQELAQRIDLGSIDPAKLDRILAEDGRPDFPQKLIAYLSKSDQLKELYAPPKVDRHSEDVLRIFQTQRPFLELEFLKIRPSIRLARLMPLVLAVHDIGKKHAGHFTQADMTVPIVERVLRHLGFSEEEAALGCALINGDPIGTFLRANRSEPERLFNSTDSFIREAAGKANIGVPEFFQLLHAYYVSDAASYPELKRF